MTRSAHPAGVFLAFVGAVLVGVGGFLPWLAAYHGRPRVTGRDVRVHDLFHGISDRAADFTSSAALVLVGCGAVMLLGALVASRSLVILGVLVGAALTVSWIVLEAVHRAPADFGAGALRVGAWVVLGGLLLGLIGTIRLRRARA